MKIVIHRGTRQIGGVATEFSTETTRILIDMGDEISTDPNFVPTPLDIPGITDDNGTCDGVFFTHYHGDHMGQMTRIRKDIPLYAGALAKDVMGLSAERSPRKDQALCDRIRTLRTFQGGQTMEIGDIRITPWSIDHSACDSYMFLIEGQGKRILYTGDFRMHGFRGKALPKILKKIGKVDVLVTEGTTLSRPSEAPMTEYALQRKVAEYMEAYKYVFVFCSSTNLERICALAKAVPRGKYFLCDDYQKKLLQLMEKHWGAYSPLFRELKTVVYGDNILPRIQQRGCLMLVRDNWAFRQIIPKFPKEESIILYSMWDGYRTRRDSTIPDFLALGGGWQSLHTTGHASHQDLQRVVELSQADLVIPMHSEAPEQLNNLCTKDKILMPQDGETIAI